MNINTVECADVLDYLRSLPDESVNCVVTSPPYFGLRDYGVSGQIGLEPTPAAFVATMVAVFREARRVLRDDGTCFINLGDSYAASGCGSGGNSIQSERESHGRISDKNSHRAPHLDYKEKDLMMIPARVAIALCDDGWYLRSEIVWSKPNPMPESVSDRPTKAHEMVYLLAKRAKYWYDADAVRERQETSDCSLFYDIDAPRGKTPTWGIDGSQSLKDKGRADRLLNPAGRNRRSVWTIPTESNAFAHFATFPRKLIEPMILAGCPARTCATCGKPWGRVAEREYLSKPTYKKNEIDRHSVGRGRNVTRMGDGVNVTTLGFRPTCDCAAETRPGLVLDPFMGSGTTALVARDLGRNYIGCDLNPEYVKLAQERLSVAYTPPLEGMF